MDIAKFVLEIFNSVIAVGVFCVAMYGLRQIRQAKKALKTQSLRDTRKITADYTYLYLDRIINKRGTVSIEKSQTKILKNFSFSEKSEDSIDHEKVLKLDPKLKLNSKNEVNEYVDKLVKAVKVYTNILNELEAFCAAVTSGILDEEVLYKAIGQNFVNYIESKHLAEGLHYVSKRNNLYLNITEVFDLWRLRSAISSLEEVERANVSTAKEIEVLKKSLRVTERHTIDRIGVDD